MKPHAIRRILPSLVALSTALGSVLFVSPTPVAATNGLAIMNIYASPADVGSSQVAYGEGVWVYIEAEDRSGSCITVHDCDQVTGTAYYIMTNLATNQQYLAGTAGWAPGLLYGTSFSELPYLYLPAGDYAFDFAYEGNFDTWDTRKEDVPIKWYQLHNVITVYKRPCTPVFTVTPAVEPLNTTPVVLKVDLGAPNHTGYVDFTGPTGGRIARVPIDPNGQTATYTLPYYPDATTAFQATYSGDANNYGCASSQATYTVPETHTGSGVVYVPSPVSDAFTIDLGSTLDHADVLGNDTQMPLTQKIRPPSQLELDSNPGIPEDVQYLAPPDPGTIGTVTYEDDATITFVPAPSWDGTQFAFTYVAYDADSPSTSGRARVYITGRCAVGLGDSYDVQPDTARTVSGAGVLANDTGKCDGDAQLVTPTAHGQVDLHDDGSFTYTPDAGFLGVDTFTYSASDDPLHRPVEVLLSVFGGACVPSLAPDAFDVSDHALTLTDPGLTANDALCRDVIDVATPPQHGTVTVSPSGGFEYHGDPGYVGPDSFTYGVVDQVPDQIVPAVRGNVSATVIDPDVATASVSLNVLADPVTTVSVETTAPPTTVAAPTTSDAGVGADVGAGVTTTAAPIVTPPMVIDLPSTGSTSLPVSLLALVLASTGVGLVALARRRRIT